MALLDLYPEEMIEISKTWLAPAAAPATTGLAIPSTRHLLEAVPLLREMLPLLEEAHQAVLTPAKRQSTNPADTKKLYERQITLDTRHDDLVRGIFGYLSALADLSLDPTRRAELFSLQELLIPEKLARVNLSYRREAGAARRLEARLSQAHKDQLAAMVVPLPEKAVTLLSLVDELITTGKELGDLEDAKEALSQASATLSGGPNQRDAVNLWINHATMFLRLAEALRLAPEVQAQLFGPLRAAEERATQRKVSRSVYAPSPEVPAGEVPAIAPVVQEPEPTPGE